MEFKALFKSSIICLIQIVIVSLPSLHQWGDGGWCRQRNAHLANNSNTKNEYTEADRQLLKLIRW